MKLRLKVLGKEHFPGVIILLINWRFGNKEMQH